MSKDDSKPSAGRTRDIYGTRKLLPWLYIRNVHSSFLGGPAVGLWIGGLQRTPDALHSQSSILEVRPRPTPRQETGEELGYRVPPLVA
eukprot:3669728-Prymnesium_polylepis.1